MCTASCSNELETHLSSTMLLDRCKIAESLIDQRAPGRIVACASRCCAANSPGFDTEFVVDRYSQTLPAANIAFGGLHRDMPEKKLYLLELASRIMAEPSAGPPEIMWREMRSVHCRGRLLDNVPNRLCRNAVSSRLTCSADTSEKRAAHDTGCD